MPFTESLRALRRGAPKRIHGHGLSHCGALGARARGGAGGPTGVAVRNRRNRQCGIGMIYVSHFLEELLDISDNLVVLRNGKRVPVHFTSSGNRLKDVVAAMLGETPSQSPNNRKTPRMKLTSADPWLRSKSGRFVSSG